MKFWEGERARHIHKQILSIAILSGYKTLISEAWAIESVVPCPERIQSGKVRSVLFGVVSAQAAATRAT